MVVNEEDDLREDQHNQPKTNKLTNNEIDLERQENLTIKEYAPPRLINPPSNLLKPKHQRLK